MILIAMPGSFPILESEKMQILRESESGEGARKAARLADGESAS